jgi:ribosomal protein S18 acetylase RimI-like enzyme
MIEYTESVDDIRADQLQGFFDGWPSRPDPETHLAILRGSSHVVLALDREEGKAVGFITAVSDGVLAAYLPLLEVLPEYRGRGIGTELVRRMLDRLRGLYMIDLVCDSGIKPFYERFAMQPAAAMAIRKRENQSGRADV